MTDMLHREERLATAFSDIYGDVINRRAIHSSLVYNAHPGYWSLASQGSPYTLFLGETEYHGKEKLYLQPCLIKEKQLEYKGEKYVFDYKEITLLSYLTGYYFQAAKGLVNMPEFVARYPELTVVQKSNLQETILQFDAELAAMRKLI